MQKAVNSIAQVSFLFFIIFGGLHISSSLLLLQDVVEFSDWLIFNVLDLPFLLAALLYGSAKLSLTFENITGNLKIPLVICSTLSVVIFVFVLYLNFGLPDAKLF